MSTYKDKPVASDILANSQGDIQGNFEFLQATLGKDHQIVFNDTNATTAEGRHNSVGFIDKGVQAFPIDGLTAFSYATGGQVFFINSAAGPYQITNSVSTAGAQALFGTNTAYPTGGPVATTLGGWSFLPGGLILQYGSIKTLGAHTPVLFPIVFPSGLTPYSIQLTSYAISAGDNQACSVDSGTDSASGFTINSSSSGNITFFYWSAIGK